MKYYSLINGEMIEDSHGVWCKRQMDTSYETEESIYDLYPRKIAKKAALKSIRSALKKIDKKDLIEKVRQYAIECKGKDQTFIPHPATWFNQERWEDVKVINKAPVIDFKAKWGKEMPFGGRIERDSNGNEILVYEMSGITITEKPIA